MATIKTAHCWPLAAVLSALWLGGSLGCPPVPPTPPGPPVADDGGAGEPTCATVCDHWRELGCQEAEDTPEGATCEQVCDNVQGSGIIEWDLACRASVASCGSIDACER